MTRTLLILLLLLPSIWYAQGSWDDLSWSEYEQFYKAVGAKYNSESYYVKLRYNTFKGLDAKNPYESSVGYMSKSEGVTYSYVLGVYTIQTKEIKVTVDSINHVVAINHSDPRMNDQFSQENYENNKKLIKSLFKQNSNEETVFRLDYIESSPVSRMEFGFSRKSYINFISIYYRDKKEYEDEEGNTKFDHVWLKMEYLDYQRSSKSGLPRLEDIIQKVKGEYVLSKAYEGFELIDLRYKP